MNLTGRACYIDSMQDPYRVEVSWENRVSESEPLHTTTPTSKTPSQGRLHFVHEYRVSQVRQSFESRTLSTNFVPAKSLIVATRGPSATYAYTNNYQHTVLEAYLKYLILIQAPIVRVRPHFGRPHGNWLTPSPNRPVWNRQGCRPSILCLKGA